jgi:hypothetical protein
MNNDLGSGMEMGGDREKGGNKANISGLRFFTVDLAKNENVDGVPVLVLYCTYNLLLNFLIK